MLGARGKGLAGAAAAAAAAAGPGSRFPEEGRESANGPGSAAGGGMMWVWSTAVERLAAPGLAVVRRSRPDLYRTVEHSETQQNSLAGGNAQKCSPLKLVAAPLVLAVGFAWHAAPVGFCCAGVSAAAPLLSLTRHVQ